MNFEQAVKRMKELAPGGVSFSLDFEYWSHASGNKTSSCRIYVTDDSRGESFRALTWDAAVRLAEEHFAGVTVDLSQAPQGEPT